VTKICLSQPSYLNRKHSSRRSEIKTGFFSRICIYVDPHHGFGGSRQQVTSVSVARWSGYVAHTIGRRLSARPTRKLVINKKGLDPETAWQSYIQRLC
jgi:hypothetical protein